MPSSATEWRAASRHVMPRRPMDSRRSTVPTTAAIAASPGPVANSPTRTIVANMPPRSRSRATVQQTNVTNAPTAATTTSGLIATIGDTSTLAQTSVTRAHGNTRGYSGICHQRPVESLGAPAPVRSTISTDRWDGSQSPDRGSGGPVPRCQWSVCSLRRATTPRAIPAYGSRLPRGTPRPPAKPPSACMDETRVPNAWRSRNCAVEAT